MQDKISQKSDLPKNGKITLLERIEFMEKMLPEIMRMLEVVIEAQLRSSKKDVQKTE